MWSTDLYERRGVSRKGVPEDKGRHPDWRLQVMEDIEEGKVEEVLAVLTGEFADDLDAILYDGRTPVRQAIMEGQMVVLRALLDAGADPNLVTPKEGASNLWVAADWGKAECTTLLLERGADPNVARSDTGSTPLWVAVLNHDVDVTSALLETNTGIPCRLDLRTKDNGATPLWAACMNGSTGAADWMLRHGADPNARTDPDTTDWGCTPLAVARSLGHTPIVELLLEHNAIDEEDPDVSDDSSEPPDDARLDDPKYFAKYPAFAPEDS